MSKYRKLSNHAKTVLAQMLEGGAEWLYGYDIIRQTGVRSGTLYPMLIRFEERGFLEATWLEPSEPGRPARHAYRLTQAGRELAKANVPDGEGRSFSAAKAAAR